MFRKKKKTSKTEIDTSTHYAGKVGCWNCNDVYQVPIKYGENIPVYLTKEKIKCKTCKCDTLRIFSEYTIYKKIMKDIILHSKIQEIENANAKDPDNHDHIQ